MFNKSRKTKLDSKIRFQRPTFRRELENARSYKRSARSRVLPNGNLDLWLQRLGLGTTLRRVVLGVFLAAAIYILYIPNFLYVKSISIEGLTGIQNESAKILAIEYLNSMPLWPQNNNLTLSKTKLISFLLKNDRNILAIEKIEKRWLSGKISIFAVPRGEKFLLKSPAGIFTVSNDGIITPTSTSTASNAGLISVNSESEENLESGKFYPNMGLLKVIEALNGALPDIIKSPLLHFEILDSKHPDLRAVTKQGEYKIFFDYKQDIPLALNQLHLLINSIAPQDAKKLYYIDMRIKNRGYVCLKGTSCTRNIEIPPTATSTPASTSTEPVILPN